MYQFQCDYTGGCCPEILEKLVQTNPLELPGYCEDSLCAEAESLILKKAGLNKEEADVFWAASGTMANLSLLTTVMAANEAVLAADTAHIHTAEAGAIEFSGHKILTVRSKDGKILPESIERVCSNFEGSDQVSRAHVCRPRAVYISFPTELGTIYSLEELKALSGVCKRHRLFLYIDGARLAYGLAASSDVELKELAECADAFYIGGTKCGALFGEAVVINNPSITPGFRYMIKQNGGLLAKGRLLGIQFETLFENDLYMQLSRHAVEQAMPIRCALEAKGVALAYASTTNQQFPILPDSVIEHLSDRYIFSTTEHLTPGMTEVRICTSWATLSENVDRLIDDLDKAL